MTDLIEWQDRCSAYRQACRGKVASVSACGGSVEEWPGRGLARRRVGVRTRAEAVRAETIAVFGRYFFFFSSR